MSTALLCKHNTHLLGGQPAFPSVTTLAFPSLYSLPQL